MSSIAISKQHVVYTSYYARVKRNLKRLPAAIHIAVSRYYPKFLAHDVLSWMPALGPSRELLDWAKAKGMNSMTWNKYASRYLRELDLNRPALMSLLRIINDHDVVLYCFERDHLHCHRSLLQQLVVEMCSGCIDGGEL